MCVWVRVYPQSGKSCIGGKGSGSGDRGEIPPIIILNKISTVQSESFLLVPPRAAAVDDRPVQVCVREKIRFLADEK